MLASMVIVFREMLEMSLVIGVLLAATRGIADTRRWIVLGSAGGLLSAVILALFMEELESSFTGDGEFVFNAVVLLIASGLIAWTVIWMRGHAAELNARMKHVGSSVSAGDLPYRSLALVSLAVVMREGMEAVFFLFGAASAGADRLSMLGGGLLGVLAGLVFGYVIYHGLIRIPLRYVFTVIGWMLVLLAAGMASQAAYNLVLIDWLPAWGQVWNSSSWLPQESMLGELLHVLLGYDERPSLMQVLVFVMTLLVVLLWQRKVMQAASSVRG